ncbi:ACP S-malonyltransferase [Paractinoplanes lichenicola]|uniref:[acyl-carrier-protein] S-malonyltransferase n=1 Tax=Paractinoplanes lichenicola TaxID=2802976 RepID=A0ABS1W097_9ACTN|nr:ACP S-malonyltransferase [Actinoplanes lichenicola]MBL7260161.1 ACP S-malonyltransferase [Actinoplanes lichenicola]
MTATDRPATAMVFPGMGPSRFADAGRFLLLNRHARRRLAIADDVLGRRVLAAWRDEGPEYAEAAHVAFLVTCLALADTAVERLGRPPAACTGLSAGLKTAAAWSGALSYEQAVWAVAAMARCEWRYFAEEFTDVVTHSFLRVSDEQLTGLLGELDADGEFHEISASLGDGFHMLSLRESRLDRLTDRISAIGGYSTYTMRPPAHARAFTGLRAMVEREVLDHIDVGDPAVPIVCDQDGRVIETAGDVRTALLDSFDHPLNWPAAVATLRTLGVGRIVVCGADVLLRRLRVTTDAFAVESVTPRTAVAPAA